MIKRHQFFVVAFILFLVVKAYNRYIVKPAEDQPTELDVLTRSATSCALRATRPARQGSGPRPVVSRSDLPL